MNMTPRNLILLVGAIIVGLVLGFMYPMLGLFLIVPVIGFVAIILLRNRGAANADEATTNAARQFNCAPDKCAIYVMRTGFVAGATGHEFDD